MADQANQVIRLAPELLTKLIKSINEALSALLGDYKSNELLKSIKNHIDNGHEVDHTLCRGFYYQDLTKRLDDYGRDYAVFQDARTGLIVITTKDEDRPFLEMALNSIKMEQIRTGKMNEYHTNRLSLGQFNRANLNAYTRQFEGLSRAQSKIFQEESVKLGFVMASEQNKDGKYTVYFSEKDTDKARDAFQNTMIETAGITGKYNEARVDAHINLIDEIKQKLTTSEEFYVVSSVNKNEYAAITPDGFYHVYNEAQKDSAQLYPRTDDNFKTSAIFCAEGMVAPVILSKSEFENSKDKSIENKLENIKKSAGLNFDDAQVHAQQEAEYRARLLVEMKLSLDNGEQPENISSFYNGSVSFSEFFAHEQVNDEHDAEEAMRVKQKIQASKKIVNDINNMPEEQKKIAREYIKDAYEKVDSRNELRTFVDVSKISEQDLTAYINTLDPDRAVRNADAERDDGFTPNI